MKKGFDYCKSKAEQDRPLSLSQMKGLMILCWEGNPELGIREDHGLAFKMAEELDVEGDIVGKAYFGAMLIKGTGPTQDVIRGISCLGFATTMGCDIAAFYLAECHLDPPLEDLDSNLEQALFHFRLCLRLALDEGQYMTDEQCALAKAQVARLERAISS